MAARKSARLLAPFSAAILAASACMLHAAPASADTSSWLSITGGYGLKHSESRDKLVDAGALSFALGVGSSPLSSVVVGGTVRSTTYFTRGTDLSVAARVASGGFARGQWGLALEAGPGYRVWRGAGDYGRFPLSAMLLLGAPWGIELSVGADVMNLTGDPQARGVVVLAGIDLLRLTLMRQGSTDKWWENPSPGGGRIAPASGATPSAPPPPPSNETGGPSY